MKRWVANPLIANSSLAAYESSHSYLSEIRDQGSSFYVNQMNADGSNRIQLTESNDISSFGIDWSPDGGKLVFVSGRDGDDDIYEGTLVTSP